MKKPKVMGKRFKLSPINKGDSVLEKATGEVSIVTSVQLYSGIYFYDTEHNTGLSKFEVTKVEAVSR